MISERFSLSFFHNKRAQQKLLLLLLFFRTMGLYSLIKLTQKLDHRCLCSHRHRSGSCICSVKENLYNHFDNIQILSFIHNVSRLSLGHSCEQRRRRRQNEEMHPQSSTIDHKKEQRFYEKFPLSLIATLAVLQMLITFTIFALEIGHNLLHMKFTNLFVGFWVTIPFTILWISMFAVGENAFQFNLKNSHQLVFQFVAVVDRVVQLMHLCRIFQVLFLLVF